MFFAIKLGGSVIRALFDPGAMVSLINIRDAEPFRDRCLPSRSIIKGVTGAAVKIHGFLKMKMDVDGTVKSTDS